REQRQVSRVHTEGVTPRDVESEDRFIDLEPLHLDVAFRTDTIRRRARVARDLQAAEPLRPHGRIGKRRPHCVRRRPHHHLGAHDDRGTVDELDRLFTKGKHHTAHVADRSGISEHAGCRGGIAGGVTSSEDRHMLRRTMTALLVLGLGTSASARHDLTAPGRLAVGVATAVAVDPSRGNRSLPVEIWYPARRAGRDAEPLRQHHPLVLVAHGLCGSRLYYDYLAPHLASYGFVVAAPDFTGMTRAACDAGQLVLSLPDLPLDLSFVARQLRDTNGPFGKWARHVRGAAVGLIGNSLGGIAVVDAARADPTFRAIVGLAPAVGPAAAAPLVGLTPPRAWMIMGATS